jgi:hypothetical protein
MIGPLESLIILRERGEGMNTKQRSISYKTTRVCLLSVDISSDVVVRSARYSDTDTSINNTVATYRPLAITKCDRSWFGSPERIFHSTLKDKSNNFNIIKIIVSKAPHSRTINLQVSRFDKTRS